MVFCIFFIKFVWFVLYIFWFYHTISLQSGTLVERVLMKKVLASGTPIYPDFVELAVTKND